MGSPGWYLEPTGRMAFYEVCMYECLYRGLAKYVLCSVAMYWIDHDVVRITVHFSRRVRIAAVRRGGM